MSTRDSLSSSTFWADTTDEGLGHDILTKGRGAASQVCPNEDEPPEPVITLLMSRCGRATGGEGDNGRATSIAGGKLSVPAALWKVIVVLPVDQMM